MPKGPKGERRKADVIANAVHIMRIATGEEAEKLPKTRRAEGGRVGGKRRAEALSPEARSAIAKRGAATRWGKKGNG
jgi:hypothetical protein